MVRRVVLEIPTGRELVYELLILNELPAGVYGVMLMLTVWKPWKPHPRSPTVSSKSQSLQQYREEETMLDSIEAGFQFVNESLNGENFRTSKARNLLVKGNAPK